MKGPDPARRTHPAGGRKKTSGLIEADGVDADTRSAGQLIHTKIHARTLRVFAQNVNRGEAGGRRASQRAPMPSMDESGEAGLSG